MTRAPARDETAQSSGEYVGAVGFVAAIAVAVIALSGGFASSAVSVAEKAFCTVGTPLGLGPCEGGDGVDGVPPEVTPEEQATAGDYVALGDSYSSGEGADDYLEGTDDDDATKESVNDFNGWLWPGDPHNNICRRSENAYSAEVYGAFDFQGNYVFGACSGGVMEDYYEDNTSGNEDEGPQRELITDDTSLVTISMGGNDFGFGPVVSSCISGGSCATDDHAAEVDGDIDARIDDLAQLYRDLTEDAPPGARILVVGYPQMFPDEGKVTNGSDSFIGENEQQWLNERGGHANSAIQEAIRRSGTNVEYVDISDALEGHEIGTDNPWINDLDWAVDGGGWVKQASRNSFHPNAGGHDAIADIVAAHVRKGP